jgi:Lon-like ATP-dependent protease
MEVIDVSGYIADEKVRPAASRLPAERSAYLAAQMAIAERHLVPELREKNGLSADNVVLTHAAIDKLIRHYCSESGVRKLKQYIDKVRRRGPSLARAVVLTRYAQVFRKAAKKILDSLPAAHIAAHEAEAKAVTAEGAKGVQIDNAVPDKATTGESSPPVTPSDAATTAPATGEPVKGETRKAGVADPKPLPIPEDVKLEIGPEDLVTFLGPPPYKKDRIYTASAPPGVVIGLGYRGDGSGSVRGLLQG